ncbi:MAG: hypothetical protein KJ993_05590, partial [Actinobacteria bacterium]|nr:hypothetical protein [Actinomycetota bacterium]
MAEAGVKPQREIARLRAQIKKLERDRDRSFPDLGRATYQAFLDGRLTEPLLGETCAQIKSLEDQAEQVRSEIARLQAVAQQMKAAPQAAPQAAPRAAAVCPACGAA